MYDVLVVGGGHAGVEAAAAADRTGAKTALVTLDLSKIGVMSCNPAIGGVGKGHLVKEIDALDGVMPRAIDKACIQFRMLNASKGPAVRGPRAQADRRLYAQSVQKILRGTTSVQLIAGEASGLIIKDGSVGGIQLVDGAEVKARSVIITSGTFLGGKTFIGHESKHQGREGEKSCFALSDWFRDHGVELKRLKTGTPARLDGRTVNWDVLEKQPGDKVIQSFSSLSSKNSVPQIPCWITHTNEKTHDIVRASIDQSSIFNGEIESSGPRYCPSIEDKITRFADKTSHQVFVEPEGLDSNLLYPNGISTSLPRDVQVAYLRSMAGFEAVEVQQFGYAVEYDYVDPRMLTHNLEFRNLKGLYLAGQINGTTGYEEAAAQGLIAGVSASLEVQGKDSESAILGRDQAYIGVLIDDLVTKGVTEPYRMFTSRAEHRLILRPDNAITRLNKIAEIINCLSDQARAYQSRYIEEYANLRSKAEALGYTPNELAAFGIETKKDGRFRSAFSLLADQSLSQAQVANVLPEFGSFAPTVRAQVQSDALYAGYEDRNKSDVKLLSGADTIVMPKNFDFHSLKFLSTEECEILVRNRPRTLGDCKSLRGITPASIVSIAKTLNRKRDNSDG